jgi:hypothetical protein
MGTTSTQDTTGPDGYSNSFKVVATTAETAIDANDRVRFRQSIEAQNLQHLNYGSSSAQSVTLSFWVKSDVTGTYAVGLITEDSSRQIGSTYTINVADTWEQKIITFVGDTAGSGITNDNGNGMIVHWHLLAGSDFTSTDNTSWVASANAADAYGHTATWGTTTDDYWQITGVQLEVGTVATPFEHRSYGEELALCQRYFQEVGRNDNEGGGLLGMIRNGHVFLPHKLTVPMRSTPSMTAYGAGSTTGDLFVILASSTVTVVANTLTLSSSSNQYLKIRRDSLGSGTNGQACYFDTGTDTNFVGFEFDAEL